MTPLEPGDAIGIIGGGQLGRMLAMAAARLGLKTIILDPAKNAPAFQCANENICALFDDRDALGELFSRCAVVTYEFENVNAEIIRSLSGQTPCYPDASALETSQDRLLEKRFFNRLGIETAPFTELEDANAVYGALEAMNGEGIVKTRRFGYDGKGQIRLNQRSGDDFMQARQLITQQPCILEGVVAFEREVSIIAARSVSGKFAAFDIAENVHRNGVLYTSTLPACIDEHIHREAEMIARKILGELNYTGVMGIEFFVMKDGSLLANEFAPRVHNSGHWTEAACVVSQFEQHVRAVAGFELGRTHRHSDCVMENLVGKEIERISEIMSQPDTRLHLYGKEEARPGRKMGHFTTLLGPARQVSRI